MKNLILVLLISTLVSIQTTRSQSLKTIDDVIAQIEFKEDTVKSVFDWVTANIRYDTKVITKPKSFAKKRAKDKVDRIKKVLLTKRGVCQHYSELTDTLLKTLGFNSYVVSGYVRSPVTGKLSTVGHAWNAVDINGDWILLDSTWGAGVVMQNNRYRKKYNPYYYNTSAMELIKSHMPYDPLWQLLEKAVDYRAFDKEKIETQTLQKQKEFSSIQAYLNKDKVEQLKDASNRSNQLGASNKLVKKYFDIIDGNRSAYQLKEINELYNKVTDEYNIFVKARNNRTAQDYSKDDIKKWLVEIDQVIQHYGNITTSDSKNKSILKSNIQNAKSFKATLEKVLGSF